MTTAWQKAMRGTAPTKGSWRVQTVTAMQRGTFGDKPSSEPLATAELISVEVDLGRDGRLIANYHRAGDYISSAKGVVIGTERDKILQAIAKAAKAEAKASRLVGPHHSTMKKTGAQLDREIAEALVPTPEARRQVQTIQRRDQFPEILAISLRVDGTNYKIKVPDAKNTLGYDLVDVLVHHNGLRSIKSASRSRITPDRASKIVTKYLKAN